MADNVELDPGAGGETISTDDVGGVQVQRVKVQYGTDGNATDVSDTNPLPVDDAGGSLTVDDGGGSITVDGTVAATLSEPISVDDNGGSLTVDGTVTANAGSGPFPVSDNGGSLTVDGSVTADTELPNAAALADNTANPTVPGVGSFAMVWDGATWDRATQPLTDTQLRATPVPVSGTVTVQDGGGSVTVDGTVTANLAAGTNNIGDVDVLTLPSLPAGNNNIGDVDLASSIPAGTNNIGDVDVLTLPALPAGTNNIGDVDVLTEPATAADNAAGLPSTTKVVSGYDGSNVQALATNAAGNLQVGLSAAIPAGTNNIGDVDVLSVPADVTVTDSLTSLNDTVVIQPPAGANSVDFQLEGTMAAGSVITWESSFDGGTNYRNALGLNLNTGSAIPLTTMTGAGFALALKTYRVTCGAATHVRARLSVFTAADNITVSARSKQGAASTVLTGPSPAVGDVQHDEVNSVATIQIGGHASPVDLPPTAVSAAGDRSRVWVDRFGSQVIRRRKIRESYTAQFRLAEAAARLDQTFTLTANTNKQYATLHHTAAATKEIRLQSVYVWITGATAVAPQGIIELRELSSATPPATGNPAITGRPHRIGTGAHEATALYLPTTQGSEAAANSPLGHFVVDGAVSVATVAFAHPQAYTRGGIMLYDSSLEDDEILPPTAPVGVYGGWAVVARMTGATALRLTVQMKFTEEIP